MAEATHDQTDEKEPEGRGDSPGEDGRDRAGGEAGGDTGGEEGPAALTARAVRAAMPRVAIAGVAATALAALAVSLLQQFGSGRLAGLVLVVAAPVGMAMVLRATLVGPARRAIGDRKRRMAMVWVPRAMLFLSLWGWTTAVVPWRSVVVLPLTAFLLTRLVGLWCALMLDREATGAAAGRLEDRALAGALAFLALMAGLTIGMGFFVGWSTWFALQGLAPA